MKETSLINRFSDEILIWGNGPILARKLCILITLDPLEELSYNFALFFNFASGPCWAQKWHILTTLDSL